METITSLGNIVCNLENGGTLTIDDDLTLNFCWSSRYGRCAWMPEQPLALVNVLSLGGSLIYGENAGGAFIGGVIDMGMELGKVRSTLMALRLK